MNQRLMVGVSVLVIGAATLTGQAVTAQLGITEGRAREAVFDSFMAGAVSVAGNAQVDDIVAAQCHRQGRPVQWQG